MEHISSDEARRWRVEIEQAEDFRKKNFGYIEGTNFEGAGENIEFFERGDVALGTTGGIEERPYLTTINMVYTVTKNIVPTLYFRNPKILALPKRKQDEPSAPFAAELLNYYFNELNMKEVNQQAILDAYLFGMGIVKIGYATQFGMDIPDEGEQKKKGKRRIDKILEGIGIKKKKEEEKKQNIELEENIVAENPYVTWVNPFDFLIDPRATSIQNAQWVAQRIVKTLDEVKKNPNFKNTSHLTGSEVSKKLIEDVPETQLDKFKTVNLHEIHYKTPEGIKILILAEDGRNWEHLYHDKSIYEMDGYQFEILYFNKHGHKLYPRSDVDIIKPLQERITTTLDAILDQIDSFVPKIGVDETKLTADGKIALRDGNVGAIVDFNTNPNDAYTEMGFTQLKADLSIFIDKLIDIVALESGLTRAQLTGLSTALSPVIN